MIVDERFMFIVNDSRCQLVVNTTLFSDFVPCSSRFAFPLRHSVDGKLPGIAEMRVRTSFDQHHELDWG